ncbi:MAG: response regulator [Desulfobacteraceae bacterium]|nr:response regulator [Desulfobacteraceae bacterium]
MLKVKTKFQIVSAVQSFIPVLALLIYGFNSDLENASQFHTAATISFISWFFMSICCSFLPGFGWIFLNQIKKISKLCSDIKKGRYSYFDLPNQPSDPEEENEIIVLMRNMNWMTRKIAVREAELEERVQKRTKEILEINSKLKHAKEKAEMSEKIKSEFLAAMTHEIRTPMNAISGMTSLMLKTSLSSRQIEYMNILKNSSKSLMEIINNILDFSKIETGMLELEKTAFNPGLLMEEVIDMFRGELVHKDLEIILNLNDNVPRELSGDPLRLKQILMNLFSNAFKFTEKGEIYIEVKKESINNKDKIMFSVKDTGIGIEKNKLELIFAPFTQADNSTTRRYGGTGLGLAITKKLVELMGGEIFIESEPLKGSRFYFYIDYEKTDNIKNKNFILPFNPRNKKVLLLIRNLSALNVLKNYFDNFGFVTDPYNSIEKILEDNIADPSREYSLFVADADFGSGFDDCVSKIKKLYPMINTIITGSDSCSNYSRQTDRFNSFISKPVKKSVLFDTILNIFDAFADQDNKPFENYSGLEKRADKTNILIVEDNRINQLIMEEILKLSGISFKTADTGEDALELIKKEDFHAILMDLNLKGISGYETAEIIKKDKNIPIIAVTADVTSQKKAGLPKVFNGFIEKPFNPNFLLKTISRIIDRNITPVDEKKLLKNDSGLRELDDVKGIDVKGLLKKINFNKTLFKDLLTEFADDNLYTMKEIKELLKAKDFEKALRKIHTFKGISGNIGALKLHKNLKKLESVIKTDILQNQITEYSAYAAKCENEFNTIYFSIKSSRQFEKAPKEENKPMSEDLIIKLETLLKSSSLDAKGFFSINKSFFENIFPEQQVRIIEGYIKRFDFKKALNIIQELKQV